jgi:perosamine synthetase
VSTLVNPPILGAYCLGEEEVEAVTAVLRRGELFRYGDNRPSENDLFESELAAWAGCAEAFAVASGTAGLRAALVSVGVGPGDRVLVSSFTFIATASAVASLGAEPVPLELGCQLDVDLADLDKKISRARAVVPVYVPGHTSNIDDVVEIAQRVGVPVVEDACQGMAVLVGARRAGLVGNVGVYSFQQGKQLSAGEGGAIVARDPTTLEAVRRFTDHGANRQLDGSPSWPDEDATIGENLRLTELQAALLRVQLDRLDAMVERQRMLRSQVSELARSFGAPVLDSRSPESDAGSHLAILAPTSEIASKVQRTALEHQLLVRPFWRRPFSAFPVFRNKVLPGDLTPRANDWASRLLTVPIPPLVGGDVDRLMHAATSFFQENANQWPSS